MAYATQTGTRRNIAALRAAGWRLLLTPRTDLNPKGFNYGFDNGAWTSHQLGEPFDSALFERALSRVGMGADWVVVPDVVMGGMDSLAMSLDWLPRLAAYPRLLVPVQDGMTVDDLSPLLSPRVGIFVGGSTEFKESTMSDWARLCREHGAWCHVGRVNTARRIRICAAAGADSIDGTSATRYAVTLPALDACRRIGDLFASHP